MFLKFFCEIVNPDAFLQTPLERANSSIRALIRFLGIYLVYKKLRMRMTIRHRLNIQSHLDVFGLVSLRLYISWCTQYKTFGGTRYHLFMAFGMLGNQSPSVGFPLRMSSLVFWRLSFPSFSSASEVAFRRISCTHWSGSIRRSKALGFTGLVSSGSIRRLDYGVMQKCQLIL